jgi:iron complex transport system ATP-binding protein
MRLSVKGAGFHYDPSRRSGFSDINLSLENGEIMCLLGPNGCGKTTLLKCINNLMQLENGSILIDDRDIRGLSRAEIAKSIGYVPQVHQPAFPFTVLDAVLVGRAAHLSLLASPDEQDVRIAEQALETLGIAHLRDKPYTEISGGERQMVVFARVVAQQPALLLLDEPTSHLDFGNQVRLLSVVEKLAATGLPIIMTSHFPDHVFMVSNKVAIMKEGAILDCGHPDGIVTEANLHRVYGIPVSIRYIDGPVRRKICIPVTTNNTKELKPWKTTSIS